MGSSIDRSVDLPYFFPMCVGVASIQYHHFGELGARYGRRRPVLFARCLGEGGDWVREAVIMVVAMTV